MKDFCKVLFILLFITSSVTFAYTPEEGNVSAILGPFVHKTNFEGSSTGANSPILGGMGLIAIGDINDHASLEIAMFYMHKTYAREQANQYMVEKTQQTHITMGYRSWFTPYTSASLAFYSAYPMGDPETIHNDFASVNDFDTSARDTTEYGFDLALQGELWSIDRIALVIDGRYSYSLTPKKGEFADHYGVLIGIRYFIQGK